MPAKIVSIYGSTGSIGKQTLEVLEVLGNIRLHALCCNSDVTKMFEQVRRHQPEFAAVINERAAARLKEMVEEAKLPTTVVAGERKAIEVCGDTGVDTVVMSPVGIAGLKPTLELIERGKRIALANKETLVAGGELVMPFAKKQGVPIIPIDSEHSAIFQSLQGNQQNLIEKIILTASGGPFRGMTEQQLKRVTKADALKHPNWTMGKKVTIDSATLMNKGLEVIEAKWLFGVIPEQIEVFVHPQSVDHSMVQYTDGSVIAQLGTPDMRTPIQYALTWPDRRRNNFARLDFTKIRPLTFEKPDLETFRCLYYAIEALKAGGHLPTVLNGANEKAVELFLDEKISFLAIPTLVGRAVETYQDGKTPVTLESILAADRWSREQVSREAMKLARL